MTRTTGLLSIFGLTLLGCPSGEIDDGTFTFTTTTTVGDDVDGDGDGDTGTESGTDDESGESETGSGSCGDANVDPGEECDLGMANGPDKACTPDCLIAACGDGYV